MFGMTLHLRIRLLRAAVRALYVAKQAGRSRVKVAAAAGAPVA